MNYIWPALATVLFVASFFTPIRTSEDELNGDEEEAKKFLARYDKETSALATEYTKTSWNYNTNLTAHNAALLEELSSRLTEHSKAAYEKASRFNATFFDPDTKRLLKKVGSPSLPPDEQKELAHILTEMGRIYGSHQVCKEDGKCYSLEPELKGIMESSTNATERLWAWKGWHDEVGRSIRPHYVKYVELKNRRARLKGFKDYGDEWRQEYETEELEGIVLGLYKQLEPLYRQLHAYIRRRLFNVYGPKVVDLKGPLPAHLLGDMWGRFWSGLGSIAQPYPNRTSVDPTPAMIKQNYTVRRMFEMGDDFFRSMGLFPLPETFYNLSMLEKPTDGRKVICHPTAWDFSDGKDFRIKMCTRISFDDFLTIHHELGHIQYDMQYAHLPYGYRSGANDGFHEAVGELMSMSVATTKHLHSVGLLDSLEDDPEVDINFLLQQALSTVSTLPFHLVQDVWRWKIFSGETPAEQWNVDYWKRKIDILGVAPPVPRGEHPDNLDPVALYHVSNDYDMIRYFTRTVMQYQFAEALCKAANHVGPLYKCDFYNSKEAGTALARMMKMGSSRPWQDAMEALTGQREMSTEPMLKYFQPLNEWLEKENARNGDEVGWETNRVTPLIP